MYGYKVTIEDKDTGETHVMDDLDGFLVAIADKQGGAGFYASDFRYHQATFEMLGYAKAMIENGLLAIKEDFVACADTRVDGEQRYWRALQEINKVATNVINKSKEESE